MLKENGWYLKRTGKHQVWCKGDRTMIVPTGNNISYRTVRAVELCMEGRGPFYRKAGTEVKEGI
jgi:hypothetical protein